MNSYQIVTSFDIFSSPFLIGLVFKLQFFNKISLTFNNSNFEKKADDINLYILCHLTVFCFSTSINAMPKIFIHVLNVAFMQWVWHTCYRTSLLHFLSYNSVNRIQKNYICIFFSVCSSWCSIHIGKKIIWYLNNKFRWLIIRAT